MTLQEFADKYKGVKVDFDGAYGAQCVDLARQYFKDVWNLPKQPEGVGGAKDFFYNHAGRPIQKQMCECITFEHGMIPPAGAVVLFDATPENRFGHIGICYQADANRINLFEQDGFNQQGAVFKFWGYQQVVGWLLKK